MAWTGIIAIDKPTGLTSRQVVDRVAKIVRPARTGHAGTLDPLATGVLVVAVGPATRLIDHIQQGRKTYVGRFRLGQRSSTDDSEGQVQDGGDWTGVTESQLVEQLSRFVGVIDQVPPQFSAVHVHGQRAYKLARRGEAVSLSARRVEVYSIRLTQFQPPDFQLEIECGSGTYIRSIGRDLGELLGCGAIMTGLRRLSVGPFTAESCVPCAELNEDRLRRSIQPPLAAVSHLLRRTVDEGEALAIRQGKTITIGHVSTAEEGADVALIEREALIGIALVTAETRLQPRIVFPVL